MKSKNWILPVILSALLPIQVHAAGPVERGLKAKGADVALPDQPLDPAPPPVELKGKPVGPIDGGDDKPPYPIETGAKQRQEAVPTPSPRKSDGTPTEAREPAHSKDAKDNGTVRVPGLATTLDAPEPVERPASANACLVALQKVAKADVAPPPDADIDACVIPTPVILKSTVGNEPVDFPPGLLLDCEFALHLAEFTADVVQPLARFHLGSSLRQVQSGQGFVCRRRNSATSGDKMSEHAFGNATDWVGFRFEDGRQVAIKSADQVEPKEAEFFKAVRAAACGYFTTVLGPGSNAAHATHFHFDRGRMKGKKNPYRICE